MQEDYHIHFLPATRGLNSEPNGPMASVLFAVLTAYLLPLKGGSSSQFTATDSFVLLVVVEVEVVRNVKKKN